VRGQALLPAVDLADDEVDHLTLAAMQTFVRVVESGGYSAVARKARTTQSGVSKQVAALERTLGAKLLSRTTRSLALTEAGERCVEQARRLGRDC